MFPVYLGVTLDRTLSFREHCMKLKGKISTRNNILGKLANSIWGADAKTLKTTAIALCYSTAEYCAPVWKNSRHTKKIDTELNNSCRKITGTLRPTPIPLVYRLAEIAPPHIRREAKTKTQKHKQEIDPRHTLYDHVPAQKRLKSRSSFMTTESLDPTETPYYIIEKWKEWDGSTRNGAVQEPSDQLPNGHNLPRKDWAALNRARTRVGRTADNLKRWKISEDNKCTCGAPQTMEHILRDCGQGPECSDAELLACNDVARDWIRFYRDKI